MEQSLSIYSANAFRDDFLQIIGKQFTVKGENMKVTSIQIEESTDGGYVPVVYFELVRDWQPFYQLDLFLEEVDIEFDLNRYQSL